MNTTDKASFETISSLEAQLQDVKRELKEVKVCNQQYKAMLMQSPFAFSLLKGKEMVITIANGLMKEFWGTAADVEGKRILEILPGFTGQLYLELVENVYKTGIPYEAKELSVKLNRRGKMESLHFNVALYPYYEGDGNIAGVITMAYEVTEMILAKRKKEENGLYFRLMADLMPSKVSNADAEGNLLYFNKQWLDYTGMGFQELKKIGYHKIIHPEDLEEFQKRFAKASEAGNILEMEMRFLNKDGVYKWHLNLAVPVKDKEGKITMWLGSTTEMHQQMMQKVTLEQAINKRTKELEYANKELVLQSDEKEKRAAELVIANKELAFQNDEKEKRAKELTRANKDLRVFTYISSHDLQEPLRKIQVFVTRILDKEENNLSDEGKDQFKRVIKIAKRMQTLINDLLTYSYVKDSQDIFENLDLHLILKEVIKELDMEIMEKKAIVEIRKSCSISVIPSLFRQLMKNIISNALKFSNPEIASHIIIDCTIAMGSELNNSCLSDREEKLMPTKNYCHISVKDNGIGFDLQYRELIFEVFQRLNGQEDFEGTGIGLAICKRIVENHNGVITAVGKLHEGARFDIYLPVQFR